MHAHGVKLSKMDQSITNTNLLPIGTDSSSEYTSHKHQLHSTSSVPLENSPPRQWISRSPEHSASFHFNSYSPSKKRASASRHIQSRQLPHDQSVTYPFNWDMRFLIVRHGERVDRYFGPDWFKHAFNSDGQYHRYHKNLPSKLPNRPNIRFWPQDSPLTLSGLKAAYSLGRLLALHHIRPHYVYSSPAMRCILTTHEILKGLQMENSVQIRIEPGLLELGAARFGMDIFFRPIDWINHGIKIDLSYQPIVNEIPTEEREIAYYNRAKIVSRQLEQLHQSAASPYLNVLIVAHATSPETLTWDLIGKQPKIAELYNLSLKVAYLQTMVAERKRKNQRWSVKQLI